jgi:formate/nitrite transporter FocA (FNT family)
MKLFDTFRSAIMAGICIGIAGFGYLAIGGIFGAILFAFGLLSVVSYGLKLYTGTAGFIELPRKTVDLLIILGGNIIGCLAVALLSRASTIEIQETAQKLLTSRLGNGWINCGLLAIGCGFIMSTAVNFARKGNWLPLLFGVPMFIICGFPHSIADAFYYLATPIEFLSENALKIIPLYISIVLGNFIGCNLYKVFIKP